MIKMFLFFTFNFPHINLVLKKETTQIEFIKGSRGGGGGGGGTSVIGISVGNKGMILFFFFFLV